MPQIMKGFIGQKECIAYLFLYCLQPLFDKIPSPLSLKQRTNQNFQFLVFKHFYFQFSVYKHFSFQIFKFLLDISQKDFNSQFSTFNIHTSKFKHFNFQIFKFKTFHIKISIFNFQFLTLSIQISQFKHFNFQIPNILHTNFKFQGCSFQYSHIKIQTFQFSKFQIPNIPYIIVPWQVWHMLPKQLINFEYSILENKILLKILYFPS